MTHSSRPRLDVVTASDWAKQPARPLDLERSLPYGARVTASGELVLFDRRYKPIFTRLPDGIVVPERPDRWVEGIVETVWFYREASPPRVNKETRARCERILSRWVAASRTGRPVSRTQLLHRHWISSRQTHSEAV